MSNKVVKKVEGNVLILERAFNAPRELVFKAFSEAEHLKHWWGPRGWTLTVCNIDFRPGGTWHYCMKCIDENQGDFFGFESWGKAIYEEIVQNEKVVYVDYFSDGEGNNSESLPSARTTMTLVEQNGVTTMINHVTYESPEALKTVLDMGMEQGISETWDRLEELLQSMQ
jgi:uncharacterized protein YndB with AHSA1/START domain